MITVILETPYSAPTLEGVAENVKYARECMRDCLMRNESVMASHLLYTQVLDDNIPEERTLGIEAGLWWKADKTVVFIDKGISKGMQMGIDQALTEGRPVEYRRLYPQTDVEK